MNCSGPRSIGNCVRYIVALCKCLFKAAHHRTFGAGESTAGEDLFEKFTLTPAKISTRNVLVTGKV